MQASGDLTCTSLAKLMLSEREDKTREEKTRQDKRERGKTGEDKTREEKTREGDRAREQKRRGLASFRILTSLQRQKCHLRTRKRRDLGDKRKQYKRRQENTARQDLHIRPSLVLQKFGAKPSSPQSIHFSALQPANQSSRKETIDLLAYYHSQSSTNLQSAKR